MTRMTPKSLLNYVDHSNRVLYRTAIGSGLKCWISRGPCLAVCHFFDQHGAVVYHNRVMGALLSMLWPAKTKSKLLDPILVCAALQTRPAETYLDVPASLRFCRVLGDDRTRCAAVGWRGSVLIHCVVPRT